MPGRNGSYPIKFLLSLAFGEQSWLHMALAPPSHNVEALLGRAEQALEAGGLQASSSERPAVPFVLRELGSKRPEAVGMDLAPDAQIVLRIELGRAQLAGGRGSGLRNGSIVTLDKQIADAVEIHAAGQLLALGELVVVDGVFCVRVTQRVAARQAA